MFIQIYFSLASLLQHKKFLIQNWHQEAQEINYKKGIIGPTQLVRLTNPEPKA